MADESIREVVQARCGQAVKAAVKGAKTSCCDVDASLAALDGAVLGAFLHAKKPV